MADEPLDEFSLQDGTPTARITRWIWKDDLPKYPEEAGLIMFIISKWNNLEYATADLLTIFVEVSIDQANFMLAAVKTTSARLELVLECGSYYLAKNYPHLRDQFTKLMTELSVKQHIRHGYAHGVYVSTETGLCKRKYQYAWPDNSKSTDPPIKLENLKRELEEIDATKFRLLGFRDLLWNSLPEDKQIALREK